MAAELTRELFPWQQEALDGCAAQAQPLRACLYHRTGAGKTATAAMIVRQTGAEAVVVVAPPSTHAAWDKECARHGLETLTVSHARFRMPSFKLDRNTAVIADEMHMFGGHTGKGWVKLDRLARGLQAPMVLASATPNYNDAERCYCVEHILNPAGCAGGYIAWLYKNCTTEQNHFSMTPDVTGFLRHNDAEDYLARMPGVYYVPDNLSYTIQDIHLSQFYDRLFAQFGYDSRSHRMLASAMERRHKLVFNSLVNYDGLLTGSARLEMNKVLAGMKGAALIYADHSTVAEAVSKTLDDAGLQHVLVTGKVTTKSKEALIEQVRLGKHSILVGTASLATGTDGLDKVCDTLLIVDDTQDDALRRQLIGRIMPRGTTSQSSAGKQVFRFLLV